LNEKLLKKLSEITPEEHRLLDGGGIERALYTSAVTFVAEAEKLLGRGRFISLRTHTRFADFPEHRHDYVEMMYVCRGKITHIIDGERVEMAAGDILLMNRYARHSTLAASSRDVGVNLIILPEFFDEALRMLGRRGIFTDFLADTLRRSDSETRFLHFRAGGLIQVQNLLENLIYSLIYEENEEEINRTLMGLIFLYLSRRTNTLSDSSRQSGGELAVQSALDYIGRSYKTATLTELSALLGWQMPALSRLLREKTGFTFKELLQHKRFETATILLCDTKIAAREIASAVGYENNSYFHRRFRKIYGMSPTEYRKLNSN